MCDTLCTVTKIPTYICTLYMFNMLYCDNTDDRMETGRPIHPNDPTAQMITSTESRLFIHCPVCVHMEC